MSFKKNFLKVKFVDHLDDFSVVSIFIPRTMTLLVAADLQLVGEKKLV